jgi:hypothetical protein
MRRAAKLTLFLTALTASCWADIASPVDVFSGSGAIAGVVLSVAVAAAGLWLARRKRTRLARVVWVLAAVLGLLVVLGFLGGRDRDDQRRYRRRPIPEPVPSPSPR